MTMHASRRRQPLSRATALLFTSAFCADASAESPAEASADPLMETIFVTAPSRETIGPIGETLHILDRSQIERIRPLSAADIARRLPSAHVTTNSRGESLVYLRNATERQTAVFFDGALVNVPWDNRYDLALFPASAVVSAASAAGPLSPQYGINALGALSLSPPRGLPDDAHLAASIFRGGQGRFGGDVAAAGATGDISFLAAAGGYRLDGAPVASASRLPFHQDSQGLRTNTDIRSQNAFLRTAYTLGEMELSATFLYADADRGIAPESDRADGVRFWRYPQGRTIMGILRGEMPVGAHSNFTGSVWTQTFDQKIDSFTDATYAEVEDREDDSDQTYGARAILQTDLGHSNITTSANYLFSRHDQRDISFSNGAPPGILPGGLTYSQQMASLGVDLEHFATDHVTLALGLGADLVDYIDTGDKPGLDSFVKPTARAAISWALADSLRVRATVGSKSRMPTMRELFGAAINRFLINPDLKPETVNSAEVALEMRNARGSFAGVAFVQQVRNTIDQRQVGPLRQRINLPGSHVLGVEFAGMYEVTSSFHVGGAVTATHARRNLDGALPKDHALERPSVLARVYGDYEFSNGARLSAEVEHVGRAWSPDETGALCRLPRSTQLNVDASVPVLRGDGASAQIYLRGDNLTNAYVEPQAGLPAPGRSIMGGVEVFW